MTYDPGNPRQVRSREQRVKLEQNRAADDVQAVMQTAPGRRFVNGLLGLCDLRSDGYVQGGRRAQRHQDYLAGARGIGITLLGQIEQHAPAETELMVAEARATEAIERETQEAEATPGADQPQENIDG